VVAGEAGKRVVVADDGQGGGDAQQIDLVEAVPPGRVAGLLPPGPVPAGLSPGAGLVLGYWATRIAGIHQRQRKNLPSRPVSLAPKNDNPASNPQQPAFTVQSPHTESTTCRTSGKFPGRPALYRQKLGGINYVKEMSSEAMAEAIAS
jgi:hypothetical protein